MSTDGLVRCPVCKGAAVTLSDEHSREGDCGECAGTGRVDPEDYQPGEFAAIAYRNR
jgi:hypothetical protein